MHPRPTPESLTFFALMLEALKSVLNDLPTDVDYAAHVARCREALADVAGFVLQIWEVLEVPRPEEVTTSDHAAGIATVVHTVARDGLLYVLSFAQPKADGGVELAFASNILESELRDWVLERVREQLASTRERN